MNNIHKFITYSVPKTVYPELFAFLATQAALSRATARLCGLLLLAIFLAMPAHMATAADATSFDPTLVTVKPRLIPVGTIIPWISLSAPEDAWAWLDCDGSTFSASQYPDLAKLYPGVLPDLRDEFLRGGTLAQIGQTAQDTTREHIHGQPPHTHSFNGSLVSGAISGTASGQTYSDFFTKTSFSYGSSSYLTNVNIYGHDADVTLSLDRGYIQPDTVYKTANSSAIAGNINNTSVAGTLSASGGDNTYKNSNSDGTTGGIETAPKHIRVRYLIRALP